MTHLKIEQNTGAIEEVSMDTLKKLYDIASSGTLDVSSNLKGRLNAAAAYPEWISYLTSHYPELYITATKTYINFNDPVVQQYFATTYGDGTGTTPAEAAAVSSFTAEAFVGNTQITNLNLSYFTGVSNISYRFAKNATSLTSVVLPPNTIELSVGTTNIDSHGTFKYCTSLTSVTLNEGLQRISAYAFHGCSSLASIHIPSTVTQISDDSNYYKGAFSGCTSLSTITGCEGLTVLGRMAFYGCSSLTSISPLLSSGLVTTIADSTFENCTGLTGTLVLPNTINMIRGAAFKNTRYSSMDLSQTNITTLYKQTLYNCSNLYEIKLPLTLTALGDSWSCDYVNRKYKITGLDNVVSKVDQYNCGIYNCELLYPLPRLKCEDHMQLLQIRSNGNVTANSIFMPKTKSSDDASGEAYGDTLTTHWAYSSSNSNRRVTIGLLYYRDIQKFGYAHFNHTSITHLVINNTTPPTYNTSDVASDYVPRWQTMLGGAPTWCSVPTLWVPDSAVATYQADPAYAEFTTIKGINTKSNGVDYDLPRYATFADWKVAADAAELAGNPMPVALIEEYM